MPNFHDIVHEAGGYLSDPNLQLGGTSRNLGNLLMQEERFL